jgi:hypothetical protein
MMPIFINKTAISYIEICIPNFDAANNYEIAFYYCGTVIMRLPLEFVAICGDMVQFKVDMPPCKLQSITYKAAIMANNTAVLTDLLISISQPIKNCICATEMPVATQSEL